MSNVGQQLASGALSGLATTVCLQPFDLLKTRMQQGGQGLSQPRPGSSLIANVTRNVIRNEGWRGLWGGTAPSLVRNVPGVAFYMTGVTQLRSLMARSPYFSVFRTTKRTTSGSVLPTLTSQGNLVAGAVTRVAVGFVLNPFSVLKARFESNLHHYTGLNQALASLIKSGPSELFRGFWASSLRDAPYAGLFLLSYEQIKYEMSRLFPSSSTLRSSVIHSLSAASAGAIATMATHPFDVIKTRIQVRPEDQYQSFVGTVRAILRERGVAGMFDGASLRMSRKVLSSAIGWAVYEGILILWTSSGKVALKSTSSKLL
ncbi:mitochondrial carrier [Coprinopsis marcescibilis]|uniref:Mitochondrial glycine transporter n=1 Tax=Coprinopsis marcescibilis TaxID=230819 RepID=A0A5C3L614_COPMA|nr:mitochondrial carrier [Coprinopsis marcescibilis]